MIRNFSLSLLLSATSRDSRQLQNKLAIGRGRSDLLFISYTAIQNNQHYFNGNTFMGIPAYLLQKIGMRRFWHQFHASCFGDLCKWVVLHVRLICAIKHLLTYLLTYLIQIMCCVAHSQPSLPSPREGVGQPQTIILANRLSIW